MWMRIVLHSTSLVAGVIGKRKVSHDRGPMLSIRPVVWSLTERRVGST
jgi:hypothetical protein